METTILLCRHGNTFNPGEIPYMVGSSQDLELTEEGERQAQQVGLVLSESTTQVHHIISAPLRRTQKFAHLVLTQLAQSEPPLFQLDGRLSELDYGEWSGKTASEIEDTFGSDELHAWNELGVWPRSVAFSPSREQVERELSSMLDEIKRKKLNTCLVTSHGRIKALADILNLNTPRKMGTGRVSVLINSGEAWHNLGWNLTPSELREVLTTQETVRCSE